MKRSALDALAATLALTIISSRKEGGRYAVQGEAVTTYGFPNLAAVEAHLNEVKAARQDNKPIDGFEFKKLPGDGRHEVSVNGEVIGKAQLHNGLWHPIIYGGANHKHEDRNEVAQILLDLHSQKVLQAA